LRLLACGLCGDECTTVNFRRHAQQELAGGRLLRMNAFLLAVGEILLDGMLELGPKLSNGFAMKTDDGANAENSTNEDVVSLVVFHASGVALVRHGVHGSIPVRSSSSRASST
jgi:hypothetical protein